MADPVVDVENISERTVSVKKLRQHIADRLCSFAFFEKAAFYNYIGSEATENIVAGILELKGPLSVVIGYSGSDYDYMPMADREFSVFVSIQMSRLYTKTFAEDPVSDAIEAVISALDKWGPEGHCRLRVTGDRMQPGSTDTAVAEITVHAEDQ